MSSRRWEAGWADQFGEALVYVQLGTLCGLLGGGLWALGWRVAGWAFVAVTGGCLVRIGLDFLQAYRREGY